MESVDTQSNKIHNTFLFIILATTFILSIKQLFPFQSVDEVEIMNWIKDIDQNLFSIFKYPPLFLYLHYALAKVYAVVLSFLGIIDNSAGFLFTETGFRITLEAGRIVNALLATLLVYMVYKTGKRFFNIHTALMAALMMAVNPLIILYAHIFKPGILTTLLVTCSMYFLLKYINAPTSNALFWGSFFCGLAIAAKFNAFPLIIVIAMAVLMVYSDRAKKQLPLNRIILFVPVGSAAGFFLGAPNWLFNPIGNIKAFLAQYSPNSGNIYKQVLPKSMTDVWLEFTVDLIDHFGWILFIVCILALIYSILSKDKNGLLIFSLIALYILILSIFGYFADRISMPLFPLVTLVIGKFLFMDLPCRLDLLKAHNPARLMVSGSTLIALLWVPVSIYALSHTVSNIKTYNLLQTSSEWNRTLEYRSQHNIVDSQSKSDNKRFNIARQIYTPKVRGHNIKLTKQFKLKFLQRDKNKFFHFVQAHLPTYEDYINSKKWQNREVINLTKHRPFYRIKKRAYQPWNPQCIYLYRVPEELLGIVPTGFNSSLTLPEPLPLPRTFYQGIKTSFLPLQAYEQNPNFAIFTGSRFEHWFYSSKKITALRIYFLFLHPSKNSQLSYSVKVNNRQAKFQPGQDEKITLIELTGLNPKPFYYENIYRLQVKGFGALTPDRGTCYMVFEPIYKVNNPKDSQPNNTSPLILPLPPTEEIPQLFSQHPLPEWVKSVYKQSGIDLSLMTFLSTRHISTEELFPLQQGSYKLTLSGKREDTNKSGAVLSYTYYTEKQVVQKEFPLTGKIPQTFAIKVDEPIIFVKIFIKELNRTVPGSPFTLTITPDYKDYFGSLHRGFGSNK
jgi:Dolichyl-phosphate-mannose-protein mannosyltransferase